MAFTDSAKPFRASVEVIDNSARWLDSPILDWSENVAYDAQINLGFRAATARR
jgi:hypothetical protein